MHTGTNIQLHIYIYIYYIYVIYIYVCVYAHCFKQVCVYMYICIHCASGWGANACLHAVAAWGLTLASMSFSKGWRHSMCSPSWMMIVITGCELHWITGSTALLGTFWITEIPMKTNNMYTDLCWCILYSCNLYAAHIAAAEIDTRPTKTWRLHSGRPGVHCQESKFPWLNINLMDEHGQRRDIETDWCVGISKKICGYIPQDCRQWEMGS
jgi:hypothetical protein